MCANILNNLTDEAQRMHVFLWSQHSCHFNMNYGPKRDKYNFILVIHTMYEDSEWSIMLNDWSFTSSGLFQIISKGIQNERFHLWVFWMQDPIIPKSVPSSIPKAVCRIGLFTSLSRRGDWFWASSLSPNLGCCRESEKWGYLFYKKYRLPVEI